MSSKSLHWLRWNHGQSFCGPLHNVFHHLSGLIAQHVIPGFHFKDRYNVVINPESPLIRAKCPILLLAKKLEPCTRSLSQFNNINGEVAISPEGEATLYLSIIDVSKHEYMQHQDLQWPVTMQLPQWDLHHSNTWSDVHHIHQFHHVSGHSRRRVLI